ncbi:hypothetical protein Bbelb_351470 [Branchiostoma belcheri]|nr:hypothetical protein Bbelb_351470 [Branchiostoma belcheri]
MRPRKTRRHGGLRFRKSGYRGRIREAILLMARARNSFFFSIPAAAPLLPALRCIQYRSRDKHHRDSGFCGISRGSLRDITRETAGYPAGVCGISRGRLRDIPRYSFGRPVVSRVPRSEKTWCETPKSTAARNGDGGVPNVYFYVLPGDLCWADGV